MHSLVEQMAVIVEALPAAVIDDICRQLGELPAHADRSARLAIIKRIPSADARQSLTSLWRHWVERCPLVSPTELAAAFRSAVAMDALHHRRQGLELVWTGPGTVQTPFRRTDQALLDLIAEARRSLLIVTFAAYKIPEVAEALVKAANRNVAITLVLETPDPKQGQKAFGALHALGPEVERLSSVFIWPHDSRPHGPDGGQGALHAKCAVADDQTALISSANLTGSALNLNMELGVLIRGGGLPQKVAGHFRQLIQNGTLTAVS